MKRTMISKIKAFILLCVLVVVFVGCDSGSSVKTTLEVNSDYSGIRTMKVAINEEVFGEYFTGTTDDLISLVETNCPSTLTWKYKKKAKTFVFTLEFSSLEDYCLKAQSLTGEVETVSINAPDSVWVNGFFAEESFCSEDLLNWLKDAVVASGMVDSSNSDKILEEVGTKVTFNGQEYEASTGNLYVDEVTYLDINYIDVYTTVIDSKTFSREIVLEIPTETMNTNGEEIKAYLAANLPEGATPSWETAEDGSTIYKVTKEEMTIEDMASFMNTYFATTNCAITQIENTEDVTPFEFNYTIDENVDMSNFVVESESYTDINYYYKMASGYELYDWTTEDYQLVDEYEELSGSARRYAVNYEKEFAVKKMDITSSISLMNDLERDFVVELAVVPSDEEVEIIESRIKEKLKSEEKTKTKVDVSTTKNDSSCIITINQSGSNEGKVDNTYELPNIAGNINYADKFNLWQLDYEFSYSESIMVSSLIDSDVEAEDFNLTYNLSLPMGASINKSLGAGTLKDGNLTLSYDYAEDIYIEVQGGRLNIWAILIYVGIILVVLVIILLVLKKLGVIGKKKKAKKKVVEESATQNPTVQQEPITQQEPEVYSTYKTEPIMEEEYLENVNIDNESMEKENVDTDETADVGKFCSRCGTKLNGNVMFCGKCGNRV